MLAYILNQELMHHSSASDCRLQTHKEHFTQQRQESGGRQCPAPSREASLREQKVEEWPQPLPSVKCLHSLSAFQKLKVLDCGSHREPRITMSPNRHSWPGSCHVGHSADVLWPHWLCPSCLYYAKICHCSVQVTWLLAEGGVGTGSGDV